MTKSALSDPGQIGEVSIANRLFVAGHSTNLAFSNRPTARHARYWGARARGGAGLVITDPIRVHPKTTVRPFTVGGHDDAVVDGLAAIVDVVHDGRKHRAGCCKPRTRDGWPARRSALTPTRFPLC